MKTKTVILLVVLVLAIGGGGYAGYRGYKSMRQAKLIKQTRKYLAKSDPRRALLFLQRALRYNPRDTEACRLMAELTETGRSPAASRTARYSASCEARRRKRAASMN